MGFNCGIVGLPNVGKSTLFNALTSTAAAEAANYPFCTIEPNKGRVAVPDERLLEISKLANSDKVIGAQLEFVDIAGLVKGASKGEGLGNQFLANIRETDAIIHVLRCFEDDNISHVEESIQPIRDIEIIETELLLSDLESINRQMLNLEKKARSGDKEIKKQLEVVKKIASKLEEGTPIRNALSKEVETYAKADGSGCVIVSAAIEAEISQLTYQEEKNEFLTTLGLEEAGLNKLIRAGYGLLNLITFFTAGPKEARAWTLPKDSTAPQGAGKIHSDFERGFIRAETISYEDYIANDGENGAKEAGKLRVEGADYLIKDGDVLHFRFNV